MKVIEMFSGIGAQAKALERIGIDFDIIATCDWDLNAIIAYDLIHNGPQVENDYLNLTDDELNKLVCDLSLSSNGKKEMTLNSKIHMARILKAKLLYAKKRSNNLIDITKVSGKDLPNDIDLMTYSFPCQDLSLAGSWHNNQGGIDRDSGNRSSLLWEIERILFDRRNESLSMPRFLLMENVTAILSERHKKNFQEWKNSLKNLGYVNQIYTLNAIDFGLPQTRRRTYMLSVWIGDCNEATKEEIKFILQLYNENNLHELFPRHEVNLQDILKLNYDVPQYFEEAEYSNPNITDSRKAIWENNLHITSDTEFVPTITTKQDRHPNSGLISYKSSNKNKMPFRYLTPRECFLLMGFDEKDFQILRDNDFYVNKSRKFFTRDKLIKMAGNSICVNVLESIFELINFINSNYFKKNN